MYQQFGLTLTVTCDCNLRCTYCYAGPKCHSCMPTTMAQTAIDRAVASISPGGVLHLGFFGGEPLIESRLLGELIGYARERCLVADLQLALNLTTNGTIVTPDAWNLMTRTDLELAVSCDGRPDVHDRHRITHDGGGSAARVTDTLRRLVAAGRDFSVVMVVRPDTVEHLAEGIAFLRELGVPRLEPSLDLWATWSRNDVLRLERSIAECADIWREGLPEHGISWFDEKAAQLTRVPMTATPRCGFGDGELAVSPTGRLYPCERLIGEDRPDGTMALPGHVLDGGRDFVHPVSRSGPCQTCGSCSVASLCNTFCRCSNYVRTGRVEEPDYLLCAWNQACLNETARVLAGLLDVPREPKGVCHVRGRTEPTVGSGSPPST